SVAGAPVRAAVQCAGLAPPGTPAPCPSATLLRSLGSNPGGSTLSGTTTVAAVNGVATFVDLSLNKTSTGYWLTATCLNTATSSSFNITAGVATQLVFGTEPGTTVANRPIAPAVKGRALDAFGNVATGFTGAVAVALGSNPGSATLSGKIGRASCRERG